MSKTLSAKYYQENEERLQKKKTRERYQNLSKEEMKRKGQYGHNVSKISQKMKNKSLLNIEKNIIE